MMSLLIRVQQLRDCCQRTEDNRQVTEGEKSAIRLFKQLVRGCLPGEVLQRYDHLKQTEPDLFQSPEIVAMAVLVDTYRDLSPAGRRRLLRHFATPPPIKPVRNGTLRSHRNGWPRRHFGLRKGDANRILRRPDGGPLIRGGKR